jgi:hypothetical protein
MIRRTEGRETWHRLIEWDKGQAASERLAAAILLAEGFESIDPSHPLGGKDGGKDMLCFFNNDKWVGAVYFPRGQQEFKSIKEKFLHDSDGVLKNNAKGIAFITNQEIKLSERKDLEESSNLEDIRIYHLERIADILNSPQMYGVRLEFLEIEMTKEEQISFFSTNNKRLLSIEEKVNLLYERIGKNEEYEDIFNTQDEEIRTLDEVLEMVNEFCDKVWFDRHLSLEYKIENEMENVDPQIWKSALEAAQKVVSKYGEQNLGPYSDFEWGMINGKLSALRWVLGDEWDMLDT